MRSGVEEQIRRSRAVFLQHVWPLWQSRFGASRVISVEESNRELEKAADRSGTDAFFVSSSTGVLIPVASRVEWFNDRTNNPYVEAYKDHYPRFTVRVAKRRPNGALNFDVECSKRVAALKDPVAKRYLPLFTIQTLVKEGPQGVSVLQSSLVDTVSLFEYVLARNLHDPATGKLSETFRDGDKYRLITVEKLRKHGVAVECFDCIVGDAESL